MKYCALKKDCVSFELFQGGGSNQYPEWVRRVIDSIVYEDEYRQWHCVSNSTVGKVCLVDFNDILTEGFDMFIRNSIGGVKRIDVSKFERYYNRIGKSVAALVDNSYEYVIYDGRTDGVYPDWFVDFFNNHLGHMITPESKFPVAIIRKEDNDDDVMQIIEYDLFCKNYFFIDNLIEWDNYGYISDDLPYINQDDAGNPRVSYE